MADNSYTSLLNGSAVAATVDGLQTINSATTVTLTADANSPLAKIIEATFTAPGQQLRMPDSRLLSLGGAPTIVVNRGANAFELRTNTGATLITNVGSGEAYYVYATANATQDGTFSTRIQGVGSTSDIATALAGFGLDAVAGQLAVDAQALAGAGLTASSPQSALNVNPDNSTIEINADQVRVKALGITAAQIADGTITSAKLASGVSIVQKFSAEVTGMNISNTLVVSTPGVPATDARFNRFTQVVEEVPGTALTDTSWDFDLADRTTYDTESSTPVATLTPSDNGTSSSAWTQPTSTAYPQLGGVEVNGTIEFAPNGAYCIPGRADGASMSFFSRQLNYSATTLFPYPGLSESTPTSPTIYSGVANDQNGKVVKLGTNKFLRAVTNPTATEIKFQSFSLDSSGNVVVIGNLTLSQATVSAKMSLCPITTTTALIIYSDGTATTLRARIITVPDAANPTAGTEQTTATTSSSNYRLCQTDADKFVIAYNNATTSMIARAITLSGVTLTFGGETTIDSSAGTSANVYDIAPLGTTSFVVLGLAFTTASTRNCREITATFSGTTITVQSASTLADSGVNSQVGSVVRISATKALVSYRVGNNPPTLAVRNYTTIASPTSDSTAGLSTNNANTPVLGFDSTNNIAFAYHPTSATDAQVFRYNVNVGTGALSTLSVTVDLGYNCALSAPVAQTNWLGSVLSGNSGYVRITDFTQQATGGTALSSAGTPANGFDDNAATVVSTGANGWAGYDFGSAQTVRIAGLRINVTGQYNLIIEGAIDSVFTAPVVLSTPGIVRLTASQIYWFQVSSPQSFRYIRIRETGGATFTIQDLYFNFGTSVRAQTAFADFASLAAITTGNWTLGNTVFTPSGVASDASETNEVLITTNSSDIDSANWEDADSLTPVTETTRIKNQTYPYVLGRGNPVTSANLYGVEPGQHLFTQTVRNTSVARLTDTKLLYSYSDGASQFVRLLTLSAGVWTPSTAFAVGTSTFAGPSKIVALDATRAVVFWQDGGTLRAIVVLESAGSLSAGAAIACSGSSTNGNFDAVLAGTDKILVAGRLDASALGINARILSVSGTTITVGTLSSDFDTTTASTNNAHSVDIIAANKALFTYRKSGVTEHRCVVLTLDLTANTVVGGTTILVKAANINSGLVQAQGTDRALITYADSSTAWSRIVTVSGTTPTLQAEATVLPGTVTGPHTLFKVDNSNFFAGYSGTALVWLKVSSNTVLQAETSIFPGGLNYLDTQTTESGPSRFPATVLASGQVYCLGFDNTDTASGVRIAGWNYADWSPVLAFSFNARSTWRIWQLESSSLRNIASSLASVHGGIDGTWYYQNASNVWVLASINTQRQALKEAFLVQVNRTPAGFYTQLSDADWNTFGWVKNATGTIDLAVGFDATNSELSQLTWGYTSRSQWNLMAEDAYRRNLELNAQVTITKLTTGPNNVKANVLYVT